MTDRHHHHDASLDRTMIDELAARDLVVRRIDDAVRADVDPWLEAVSRGFLDGERNETQREAFFAGSAYRRKIGVFDETAPLAEIPAATFASWATELTLPGGEVPACAISSVTVAPTHRRRGILRSVMAGELRTAIQRGLPVAILTVSESTIYGRFGFAPAAVAAQWSIDARRARWIGPDAPGRIDFISRAQGRELAVALHERARRQTPGEIALPGGHDERFFGTRADSEKPEQLRVIQYRSPAGDVEGVAVYRVTENEDDFTASTVDVGFFVAVTDEAYAALWRFLLSMDLIGTVRASELSVDEPLWWMIADQRAATITLRDHHYARVLDVPAALSARRYDVADTVVLDVTDPLGIAAGTFVLTTDAEGLASVDIVDDPPLGVPATRLGVAELSALLLGGVSPVTLARAGRLASDDAARLARLFASTVPPQLSFWY
ncbi:GNAT family N-acetyltransferase [Microbacterium sp. VKM Ac-2870]|uniref:GNAT family N-acetyltransferase n=1 Tax=Microbacterium sp. VKM Ac-2870 TaxID=2783825 RepID=UPI001E476659|nr:GNAT family N-acetyltransferase [Microbacterium sp. VKM Ac-2870]